VNVRFVVVRMEDWDVFEGDETLKRYRVAIEMIYPRIKYSKGSARRVVGIVSPPEG
jgi:hypothetical protein